MSVEDAKAALAGLELKLQDALDRRDKIIVETARARDPLHLERASRGVAEDAPTFDDRTVGLDGDAIAGLNAVR